MLSLKKLLQIDPKLEHLDDVELEAVRDAFYEITQLGFDIQQSRNIGSKCPLGSLTKEDEGSNI